MSQRAMCLECNREASDGDVRCADCRERYEERWKNAKADFNEEQKQLRKEVEDDNSQ